MWSIPMDIAPKYFSTAAGLMNTDLAAAAIVSPLVAGYVIDVTGNWYLGRASTSWLPCRPAGKASGLL